MTRLIAILYQVGSVTKTLENTVNKAGVPQIDEAWHARLRQLFS